MTNIDKIANIYAKHKGCKMENRFDISKFVDTTTEASIVQGLIARVKKRRKELKWSQSTLATKSGVSYGSIRRFEATGEISLSSLIKIAHAMDCMLDFNHLFQRQIITNLKDYNG